MKNTYESPSPLYGIPFNSIIYADKKMEAWYIFQASIFYITIPQLISGIVR